MKQKIISAVFILIFTLVFSFFNSKDFFEHKQKTESFQKSKVEFSWSIKDFSLEKIRELEKTEFYYTPNKSVLNDIVNKINSAKKRVYVEVYMLTENRIKESIVKAKKRWLDVKVVLENNPYKSPNLNDKHFDFLKKSQIDVVWSNPKNYSLNHSKFMILDEELVLSTGNFTYSTFTQNRDLFIFTFDSKLVSAFTEIFLYDFKWEKFWIYDDNLVLSPNYSRWKLEKMFLSAEKDIKLYFQYVEDEELEKILYSKAKSGVNIELVLSKETFNNSKDKVEYFEKAWIKVNYLKKNTMHSKAILVDYKYLFIWSINFSTPSIDQNRETWLLIINQKIIDEFLELFKKDFEN